MEQQAPDRTCQHCGTALTEETTGGLCPRCLLAMNFASRTMPGGEASPQVPPPSPEEMAARFPQFEILECLGRGGMGIVYKARQKTLDRLVAIKVLAAERRDDPQFEARFLREARTLAKLNHPNIVTVHEFGESDGMFFLVMEFVDGVNLRDILRDGRMEPSQALAIVPEICAALQFAHDHKVVHRDIKPENILLDRDGRVKIADFGIASLVGAAVDRAGTPPYMAPEQETAGGTIDHRADIYALGVVFYEMLTGERPDHDPSRPSQRVEIDVRLDEIVLRALEKEPARRYQTAGEFRTVVQTMAAPDIDRAAGRPAQASTVHRPRTTGPAEQGNKSAGFLKHLRILATAYQVVGALLMTGAFIPPILTGIALAGHKPDWHEILPLMIAAIFAWLVGLGLGGFLVHLGNELRKNHRPELCRVSAIILLVLSILTFPPLAILAIYTLIVLKKDDVARPRGMFARFWWLFLGILVLGPLVAATIGARMMSPKNDAFTETVILAIFLSPLIALGLTAALHRFFPEPQPRLRTASVAGALVIALVLTTGFGIKYLAEFRNATLVHVPPGPVRDESPNTPEHAARSFMEAMRDGDIESAMRWVDPEMADKQWRAILPKVSEELRNEAYVGNLDRLTVFTEWYPEPCKDDARFLAVRVAAPSGGPEAAVTKGLYLILSSTREGWRVATFGDAGQGKSLSEYLADFAGSKALIHPVEPAHPDAQTATAEAEYRKQLAADQAKSVHAEQVARSFMEAIRDGDMDAAMAWMLPEMKQFEKLPLHLELASKILRDEIYAGQLDRLTRFTDQQFRNVDGTMMLFAVSVTPPAGDQAKDVKHGPVLILSSTPDGWRVVHFGEDRAGESLSDHVKKFLRMNYAIVAALLAKPQAGRRQVDLLDVDAHQGPVVLDLASGELLPVPKEVASHNDFIRHFAKLGKGDIAWDRIIITLRGARLSEWLDNGWTLRNPEHELDGSGGYRLTVPSRLRVTTAEGGHYIVDVREKIEGEKGVRIEYYRSDPSSKDAILGKWQAPDGKTRIEFFADGTMAIFDGSITVAGNYTLLDDGRVKTVINVSGTSAVETIQVSVVGDVMTTIDERGNKQELKRVPSAGRSPAPQDTGQNTPEAPRPPEAAYPQEGADIRRFVLDLPVKPPIAMPKDSPLTLEQAKAALKGVTWGKFLAALAADGKRDDITVREDPSAGEQNSRYEIAFSYETGPCVMDLAVDWKFRSAEPSRLRFVGMPDKVLTQSSEFLPQLVVRYAMKSDHAAAAPALDAAKTQLRQAQNREVLKRYALALMIYQENMGSFPPDLATLLDGDYPGNKPWESLRKDGLMYHHLTGKKERPVYHGNKELRANDPDVTQFILVAAPSADPQGKRLVAFLDASVKIIDEADYQKQVRKQAEEAKAPGPADQAGAANPGAANTQLQELTGILKRTVKELTPYQLELDGATGSMLLQGDVLKDIPDGTRIRVRGHLKTRIHDNSNDPTPAMPMQWHVYMDVRECQRIDNRFDKDPEKRPAADQIPATTISATPAGISFNGRAVALAELEKELRKLPPGNRVHITADPKLDYQTMAAILDMCRKVGLNHITWGNAITPSSSDPGTTGDKP